MIGSLVFAKLGDVIGIKKSIVVNILFWIAILVFIFIFVEVDSYLVISGLKIHYFFIVWAGSRIVPRLNIKFITNINDGAYSF